MASSNYYLFVGFKETSEDNYLPTTLQLALQYNAFAYECKTKTNAYIFEFPSYSKMVQFKQTMISITKDVMVKTLKCHDTYNVINL